MSIRQQEHNDIEQMFNDFQQTRFYQWLDVVIAGPYRWMILPIIGIIDAFVVILPTELIIAMYMMRNQQSVWWVHTLITSIFAGVGYVILALIVSFFGIDAVSWLGLVTGDELAHTIDRTLSAHVALFAISAGVTSIFPMPMTAFAISAGLFSWSVPLLFIGAVTGKFFRFGIFAYGAKRWGQQALQYYFRNANWISVILVILIVLYLVIQ